MNDFMKLLVFNDKKENMIDELKKCDVPILLYGGGSYARDVLKYLDENGISVEKIFADDVLPDIIRDYRVERISVEEIDFNCVVVMGFAKYLLGQELANENKNIIKVYYPVLMPYDEIAGYKKESVLNLIPEYQRTYELLEDDFSRECMVAFLNSRINEDASFCFPCYEREQTYFDNSVFSATPEENYLDIGAYTGDTIRLYVSGLSSCPVGHIWAIEADDSMKPFIDKSIKECGVSEITEVYYTGLWNEKKTIYFSRSEYSDEEGFVTENGDKNAYGMNVDTLDSVLQNRKQEVSLLKVNFCDAEKILEGGVELIKKDLPKLAIVVAFGSEMIARIPAMIKKICPRYRVYLRFNSPMPARIVCYAVCG